MFAVTYCCAMGTKNVTLGYTAGYWGSGPPAGALEAIKEADKLGFDSAWTAEAYGSDALDRKSTRLNSSH